MSVQVPSSWEFVNTLLNWVYQAAIMIMFAFAWNFDYYGQKLLRWRMRSALSAVYDMEG